MRRSRNHRLPGGGYGYSPGTFARNGAPGLGVPWATIIPIAVEVGQQVAGGGDRPPPPWGSSYSSAPRICPGQESHQVALATVRGMSYSEKYQLTQYLRLANQNQGPSVAELADPGLIPYWTQAAHGGHDCQATSPEGQRLKTYWQGMVDRYGQVYAATTPDYQEPSTIPGTNIPLPDVDIRWPATPPPPGTYTGAPVPTTAGIGGALIPLALLAAALFFIK